MSERQSRGGRPSREYFNAPLISDTTKDGRRSKRILHHSRNEDDRKVTMSAPVIMARPTTILVKPKDLTSKSGDDRTILNERTLVTSSSFRHFTPHPSSSSQVLAKPVVSILSSSGAEKQQAAQAATMPSVCEFSPQMKAAIRLIGDNMEFTDYVQEYLSDTNTNFCVIGVIGPQGTGKSTLLSMLAGNDHQDMYRHYAFRPASREAVESCRFQTSKISIFVTKNRSIFLDCQAMFSASMLDELLQSGRRGPLSKISDRCDSSLETQIEIESIQLVSFLMQVCHAILLCVDWFIDVDVIRRIRTSEMLRSTPLPFAGASEAGRFKPNRKVTLVIVHQKAKSEDFYPTVLSKRSELLKRVFADSALKLDDSVSLGGMRRFGIAYSCSDINYIPLADIKPRPKSDAQPNLGKETFELHDPVVDYETVVRELRVKLPSLHRDSFVIGEQLISEKQWYIHAMRILRSTFGSDDIAKFASLLGIPDW